MGRLEEKRMDRASGDGVLLVPNMAPYCVKIMAAVFDGVGFNPHILEESDESLALGHKHTAGGECVPCPVTTGAIIKAMQDYNYKPENVSVFMPTACGPCRFGQYAKLDSMIFEKLGWDKIKIFSPSAENAYEGLPMKARLHLWHAMIIGDIFRKMACRARPYEINAGETDQVIETHMDKMAALFKTGEIKDAKRLLQEAMAAVQAIAKRAEERPLIGVVGEIYVRSDPVINNNLLRRIEQLGGEAWLAPFTEWIFYVLQVRHLIAKQKGLSLSAIAEKARAWLENHFVFEKWEHYYYDAVKPLLGKRQEWPVADVMAAGQQYLPWQFEGEAVLTLGRAELFVKRDGCRAIVNASPMFCMPGTVTASIFPALEKKLGVPVLNNFYDGSGDPNQSLAPVMHYLTNASA